MLNLEKRRPDFGIDLCSRLRRTAEYVNDSAVFSGFL